MAVSTYGVTSTQVQEQIANFTFDTASKPTAAQILNIIQRIAARINGLIRSLGVTPSIITTAAYPEAYYACQNIILKGCVADILRSFSGAEGPLAAKLSTEFEAMVKEAQGNPQLLLADAYSASVAQMPRSHVTDEDFDNADIPSGSTDAEPDFRMTDDV